MLKKAKLLKMSNFTYFHYVFNAICILKSLNSHILIVVSSFFGFGKISELCIGEWVKSYRYLWLNERWRFWKEFQKSRGRWTSRHDIYWTNIEKSVTDHASNQSSDEKLNCPKRALSLDLRHVIYFTILILIFDKTAQGSYFKLKK